MMKSLKSAGLAVVAGSALFASGCTGLNPYRSVDLRSDLNRTTLQRYQTEEREARAAGQSGMLDLEYSNLWPLGLVLYYQRGGVMLDEMEPEHERYMVSEATGLAPLAVLYAEETSATYDETGQRIGTMSMGSVLWGHLFMSHEVQQRLPSGEISKMKSWHIAHHLINIHWMDGHMRFSLFSMPNPVEFEAGMSHDKRAGHAHH